MKTKFTQILPQNPIKILATRLFLLLLHLQLQFTAHVSGGRPRGITRQRKGSPPHLRGGVLAGGLLTKAFDFRLWRKSRRNFDQKYSSQTRQHAPKEQSAVFHGIHKFWGCKWGGVGVGFSGLKPLVCACHKQVNKVVTPRPRDLYLLVSLSQLIVNIYKRHILMRAYR